MHGSSPIANRRPKNEKPPERSARGGLCPETTGARGSEEPFALKLLAGELALAVADGMAHPALADRAPFDLLIANILAGPLIELAGDFVASTAPGGTILLAGLLDTQAEAVTAAYAERGCRLVAPGEGEWRVLVLERAR